ncbi:hypothetical protein [Sulfurimonas sp.]|uniref:hypothetical protein n=1 Tax=Sulfurimonas sp. TaxID=2022749 RepID=UPI002AB23C53|nr:hypothetical protein [Sulfurimonas sp.]
MNDLTIEYLLNYGEITAQKDKKIEMQFLDEFGEGKTNEDEIVQNLIFTCEEGVDYTKI